MLTLPRSIVSRYRPFVAACLDPANIVAAARNRDAQGHWRWLHRFRVDKVSFDLGQMMSLVGALGGVSLDGAGSPRVDVEFSFDDTEQQGDASPERHQLERLLVTALDLQASSISRGAYRHNIGRKQDTHGSDRQLLALEREEPPPLLENMFSHGDIVVVDALVERERRGSQDTYFLIDFPKVIRRPADQRLALRVSASVRAALARRPDLRVGWHPYCRVLARYDQLSSAEPVLEPILISFRRLSGDPGDLSTSVLMEWKELRIRAIREHAARELALRLMTDHLERARLRRSDLPHDELSALRKIRFDLVAGELSPVAFALESTRAFEDDVFSGPIGFLTGLYLFLKTYGFDPHYGARGDRLAFELRNQLFPFSDGSWGNRLAYLKVFDALRVDQQQLEILLSPIVATG